jgi:hypothetical protein
MVCSPPLAGSIKWRSVCYPYKSSADTRSEQHQQEQYLAPTHPHAKAVLRVQKAVLRVHTNVIKIGDFDKNNPFLKEKYRLTLWPNYFTRLTFFM